MAFSGHRQVEIQAGDRVIISASAIPGNEKAISRIINELYRKGAEVIYDKLADLHAVLGKRRNARGEGFVLDRLIERFQGIFVFQLDIFDFDAECHGDEGGETGEHGQRVFKV